MKFVQILNCNLIQFTPEDDIIGPREVFSIVLGENCPVLFEGHHNHQQWIPDDDAESGHGAREGLVLDRCGVRENISAQASRWNFGDTNLRCI